MLPLIFFFFLFYPFNVCLVFGETPLTPKASAIRYWNKHISNDFPKPCFLLNKASPLDAVQLARFSKLADHNYLSTQLPAFCSEANLFCFPDTAPTSLEKHDKGNGAYSDKHGYFYSYDNDAYSTYSDKHSYFKSDGNYPYSGYSWEIHGYFKSDGNGAYLTYSDKHGYFKSDSASLVKGVEPGTFFREENLRTGTIMPMPDIGDNMPKRSFLPRVIVSKLPFSVSKIPELQQIFNGKENSTMAKVIKYTLTECERVPSKGENKRCIASVEDMVDFATSVLGTNLVVRTTENTARSKGDILIGNVKGINGGNVTKSVSCHQSLFPYLVYYCHTVPKVHVYEADILDPKTKNKINHGVAICHLDTSAWSPTHAAFFALGSAPGKIKVCHWIFENDMTWTIAD